MEYCVYVHRRKDNNQIFYVGMGKPTRPYKNGGNKTRKWKEVNSAAGGHIVQIIDPVLTKEQASEFELLLMEMATNLVNVQKNSTLTKSIDNNICDFVYYDESSPTCLRWKKTTSNKSIKDRVAGSVKQQRVEICINGNKHLGHRVVMKLHGVDNPDLTVNHKDCNPLNNKISNLELVSQAENNKKKQSHIYDKPISRNTSGKSMMSETFRNNQSGKTTYYAVCQWVDINGKNKSKTFSYLQYGILEAFSKACEFRDNHIRQ